MAHEDGPREKPRWAGLSQEIIESGLDDACFRVYAYLLRACGPKGSWEIAGATKIGGKIGMQDRTLLLHADHLAEFGLVEFNREGREKYRFRVIHNPLQALINPSAHIPPPRPYARKASRFASPTARGSRVSEARPSQVKRSDSRGTSTTPRPARIAGLRKSVKYEGQSEGREFDEFGNEMCAYPDCTELIDGHTFCDHEPVRSSAHLIDEQIGLFPSDRGELLALGLYGALPLVAEMPEEAQCSR